VNEEFIKEIIKATISGERHLGTNLKEQCLTYFDNLISENQQLKEQLEKERKARKEAIEYINVTEYSGIVGLNNNGIKEFWFMKDLLEILDNKGE
jgi:hypothetical protein